MKRVVVDSGLHDAAIRPHSLLSEFRRQSIEDAARFFADPAALVEVACPACDGDTRREAFRKEGFVYQQCAACASLYVSPRPTQAALAEYYQHSKASGYRVEHFQRETAEARRTHQFRSLAQWLGRMVQEQGTGDSTSFVDVGTNSAVVFEEIQRLGLFEACHSLDPLPGLEEDLKALEVQTLKAPMHDAGAISAWQQLEHQFSPYDFIASAHEQLSEGGMLFFTTRVSTGFDLQMLWDKTPYIFVPEHLNLLSLEGIERLLKRTGLEVLELSTPGQLDLELTAQAAASDSSIQLPDFITYLINQRDTLAHADFQAFLQKHRLSSHVRVAAIRKKGTEA